MAVGNITKAARTLNFRNIITTAPKRIIPRMIPIMKLNGPRAGTHGRKAPQKVVKPGDSKATALAITRPAAIVTNTAGNHHHLTSSGGFGKGPYHPGPNAPTGAGATGPGAGGNTPTGAPIGGAGAEAGGAMGIGAGTL